jgi:hypothetical protein
VLRNNWRNPILGETAEIKLKCYSSPRYELDLVKLDSILSRLELTCLIDHHGRSPTSGFTGGSRMCSVQVIDREYVAAVPMLPCCEPMNQYNNSVASQCQRYMSFLARLLLLTRI